MDPVANLNRQRELAAEIIAWFDSEDDTPANYDGIAELAALVQALDEWRRTGGFDPYVETPRAHVVIWNDEGGVNAQAYRTREAAERDADSFDGIDDAIIVDVLVQP